MTGFTMSCSDIVPTNRSIENVKSMLVESEKEYSEKFELFQNEKEI